MLLQRLFEYHQRQAPVPSGYQRKAVRWLVELDTKSCLQSIVPTVGKEGREKRGKEMVVPHVLRSSNIAPALLVDRADYALALGDADSKPARVQKCHKAFVSLVHECAVATREPDVQTVLSFLESLGGQPPKALPRDMAPGDLVAVSVEGRFPSDLLKVRHFWAQRLAAAASGARQCLVCGQRRPIVERAPVKIKGIPGGQPSGMALVSANAAAFESYGLEASLIAPVCVECSEAYATAANSLLQDDATHLNIGLQSYIFWTQQPAKQGIFRTLATPDPEDVKRLLASVSRGRPRVVDETDRYYATSLSASGGRVVVREWLEGSVEEAQQHLARYFRMQRLPATGQEPEYFSVFSLLRSLAPQRTAQGAADVALNAPAAIMRAALRGIPVPDWVLHEAVRRSRAEQGLSRPRAALMKLSIMSHYQNINEEGTLAMEDQKNPAYLCGRLLRILERAQQIAVNPKATLVDRYYGSASSAPGSVFGVLFRNAQAHLSKLRTEKPGLHTNLQKELSEVMGSLDSWPRTLSLREQALFALGYYHQRMKGFSPKGEAGEALEPEEGQ